MMTRVCVLLTGLALASSILSTSSAQAVSKRLSVLILTGKHNHDWKATTPALKKIYEESGLFRVDVTEDPAQCTEETFANYDVLVGNWSNWPSEEREWGADTEQAFLDFVRSGKGFVLFHAGGSTFFDWSEFHELIGGTWDKGKTGHGRYHEFEVTITDKEHPVTRGMKNFVTTDELWHRMGTQSTMRVMAEAFSDPSKGGLGGLYLPTGNFEPVLLYTEFGKGRCFNLVLGHDVNAMENVAWKTLMIRGAEWAATGEAAYPIPADWPTASGMPKAPQSEFGWVQTDESLALVKDDGVVWQHNHGRAEAQKPYFFPLRLPEGPELTWLRPPDHPWHRALWFSWKYINGKNYWEEDRKTGESEGLTEIVSVKLTARPNFSARIELELAYHPPKAAPLLTEVRVLEISAPEPDGRYRIDWTSRFTAGQADVLLDRTPILGEEGGQSWGGYAGLSFRISRELSDWQVVDSEGRADATANTKNARWLDFSGVSDSGQTAGVTLFDHPENLRHPSPWYVIMQTPGHFGYSSPALLFNEPCTLPAGEVACPQFMVQPE